MLRAALALLSTLQVGARIKESFERSLRQAAVIAIAVVLLLAAAMFGLVAAYQALVSIYHFDPAEAAAIMAGFFWSGSSCSPWCRRWERAEAAKSCPLTLASVGDATGMIDRGVGNAMKQVGPVPLLAIAFLAGLFVGRR